MIRNPSPQETVELLNELLTIDPTCINALFTHRVRCNDKMADHPTVQVRPHAAKYTVGVLGLLNALFGTHDLPGHIEGYGAITAIMHVVDDTTQIKEFVLTLENQAESTS